MVTCEDSTRPKNLGCRAGESSPYPMSARPSEWHEKLAIDVGRRDEGILRLIVAEFCHVIRKLLILQPHGIITTSGISFGILIITVNFPALIVDVLEDFAERTVYDHLLKFNRDDRRVGVGYQRRNPLLVTIEDRIIVATVGISRREDVIGQGVISRRRRRDVGPWLGIAHVGILAWIVDHPLLKGGKFQLLLYRWNGHKADFLHVVRHDIWRQLAGHCHDVPITAYGIGDIEHEPPIPFAANLDVSVID